MALAIVCNEIGCNSKFTKLEHLRKHLVSYHNLNHEPEEIPEFHSEDELESWLSELKLQSVHFTSKNKKPKKDKSVQYLQCNCSGKSHTQK